MANSNLDPNCLFCAIVAGEEQSEKVHETEDFIIIKNKFPQAPLHLLVLDKKHREKSETLSGLFFEQNYWDKMFQAIYETVDMYQLNKTGYKLVNNGAGYNHFEHEHFHIMGKYEKVPQE